ncbi:amidohydrolase family protein [Cnuella takakiae]|nr:amidohydrolase family protein [Cnuella takakiae]
MAVKMYRASRMFDGQQFLPEGTTVVVKNGTILDLLAPENAPEEFEMLSGILMPGMVNAHCHLELSHFKNQINEGGGLVHFLLQVVAKRKEGWPLEIITERAKQAVAEMRAAGIVAVGDICNTTDVIGIKKESGLQWRNFVEVLNFSDATLEPRWAHNRAVLEGHLAAGLAASILTPHAPYSVSPATFTALNEASEGAIISVHNQETPAENELFESGGGDFLQLYQLTQTQPLGGTGKSSLQSWLPYFTKGQTIVLVHNTFTKLEDIQFAQAHARQYGLKLVWCLCPGANKYIEDAVPPLPLLLEEGCTVVLGTDSYSSNWQLSIASEIKLLAEAYPQLPLESLLQAATVNGARALGWTQLGRLEKGAAPGLALLGLDTAGKLTGQARAHLTGF